MRRGVNWKINRQAHLPNSVGIQLFPLHFSGYPGDLVPDKTLKRHKATKNHRIVPFKTFSRDGMTLLVVHEQKFGIDRIKF